MLKAHGQFTPEQAQLSIQIRSVLIPVTQQPNVQSFRRTADEIRSSALAYATGQCSEQEFVETLLTLEKRSLRPYGATLSVSHTGDGWVSVLVKQTSTGKLWTAFEFSPAEATFRPFSNLSDYPVLLHRRG